MAVWVSIIVAGLSVGGTFGLAALGLSIMERVAGVLNIAYGGVMMIVGLTIATSLDRGYFGPVLSIPVGIVLGLVVMLLIYVITLRPMLHRGHLMLVVITLGVSSVLAGIGLVGWGTDTRSVEPAASGYFGLLGARVSYQSMLILIVLAGLSLILYWFLHHTLLGLGLLAAADDEEGAAAIGVVRRRMVTIAVMVSGGLAGVAAALIVPVLSVSPSFGESFTFTVVIAMVLGGLGRLAGAIIGGVVLGLVQSISSVYAPSLVDILQFALLLLALGIRGVDWSQLSTRFRHHRGRAATGRSSDSTVAKPSLGVNEAR